MSTPVIKSDPPSLPLDRSVGYQIRLTHRLVQRALQARIEPRGVTLGMWYFLRVLWIQDGLTQSELSSQIGTMEPTTLSAVSSMEQAGLVRRERHGTDKRKIHVFLTDKGRALCDELLPEGIAVVDTAVKSLTAREVDFLLSLLKAIQANLHEELGDASPAGRRSRAHFD
jgi:DNA-binding MarR family transcriptional regulator